MKKTYVLKTSLPPIFLLLFSLFCVYGCLEKPAEFETLKSVTPNKLEYEPFDILGIKHNEIVFDFTDVIGCDEDSLTFEYLALLEDSFNAEYIIFRDYLFDYNASFNIPVLDSLIAGDYDANQVLDQLSLSIDLKNGLIELFELVEDHLDYSQFLIEFGTLIEDQKLILSNDDLIIFYSTAAIAKHSYLLWSPVAKGGMNWHDRMCSDSSIIYVVEDRDGENCWSDIILKDALGLTSTAAIAVVGSGGAAALPNPALLGFPTASVIGLIGGAAASLNGAIGGLDNGPSDPFQGSLIFQETNYDLCDYYPNHPDCD